VPLLSLPVLKSSNWQDAGQPFDYTYDGKENPMLANNLRRRLDRCIYLPQKKNQYQVTLQKVGMKAIPNLTWNKKNPYNGTSRQVPVAPSDHFGLVVTFKNKS
jgi:tyrosyl-DNA phosphodiesterase 2